MSLKRVLIVNKFYYPRGGDCVCTLNLEKLLDNKGHETAVFAMSYPDNSESRWSEYFATQVQFGGSPASLYKAAMRTLGFGDIKQSFKRLLNDFRPDVVHLNNIHSYLSPVLAESAKRSGARVVWTLHDYKLICPSYSCTRNGLPCEKCFSNKWNVISQRCMKGSLAASAIAWLEAVRWNRSKLEKYVDCFICPSKFMQTKMEQAGFSPSKLITLCNFVDPVKLNTLASLPTDIKESDTYCYIGRLSPEKGITELLSVASSLPQYKLTIAGDGPLADRLRQEYSSCGNIHFTGLLDAKDISHLLAQSHASILPSRCYENNPLGAIESLCAGTPVIGAGIGGIPELITDDCGITYRWNDTDAMRTAIVKAMSYTWDNISIANKSLIRFSPETYYKQLIKIYSQWET